MSFLSKAFKGIKKVVKKVGKGIKKVVAKVSKAYGKLGIVGQIGLMFLMPGIGQTLAGWGTSMAASSNALISFAGQTLSAGVNFVGQVGNAFSKITEGVSTFFGEFAGSVAKQLKIPGDWAMSSPGFSDSFANLGKAFSEAGGDVVKGLTGDTAGNAWFSQATSKAAEGVITDAATGAVQSATTAVDPLTGAVSSPIDTVTPTMSSVTTAPATPSLLDRAVTGIKTSATNAFEGAVDTLKDPSKLVSSGIESGVKSTITSGIRQAAGVEQAPEYITNQYATYVPDIPASSDIGSGFDMMDPTRFQMPSSSQLGSMPYGNTAFQVDSYRTYQSMMNARGYQTGVA